MVAVNERRELNYDAMDEEHRRLLAVIRDATVREEREREREREGGRERERGVQGQTERTREGE